MQTDFAPEAFIPPAVRRFAMRAHSKTAPQCGRITVLYKAISHHPYAGITRIRSEGPGRRYAPSQPACAGAPWILNCILTQTEENVKWAEQILILAERPEKCYNNRKAVITQD